MGYHLPRLERADHKTLLEQVEAGAHDGIDFLVMMVLSSGLASQHYRTTRSKSRPLRPKSPISANKQLHANKGILVSKEKSFSKLKR